MSLITEQRDGIVYLANLKVVEYGKTASEQRLEGIEPTEALTEGKKILDLLYALNNEDQLTEKENEAILYCLRRLAGEFESIPTVIPPQGSPPNYYLQNPGSGGGSVAGDETFVTVSTQAALANSRRAVNGRGISITDGGPLGDLTIINTASKDSVSIAMNASPINLDLNSEIERWFYGSTVIEEARTFTKSNDSVARKLKIDFVISGLTPGASTHDLTFWANTKSSDSRWNPGGAAPLVWRPMENGNYEAEAWTMDGVNWKIAFSEKFL